MTAPNLRESLGCLPAIDRGRHHYRDEEGKASQWVIHKNHFGSNKNRCISSLGKSL